MITRRISNIKHLILPALCVSTLMPAPALSVSWDEVSCTTSTECKTAYEKFTKDYRRDPILSGQKARKDWRRKNCNSAALNKIFSDNPDYNQLLIQGAESITGQMANRCSSSDAINGLIPPVESFVKEATGAGGKDNVLLCFVSEKNLSQLATRYWSNPNPPAMTPFLNSALEHNAVFKHCSEELSMILIKESERYKGEASKGLEKAIEGIPIDKGAMVMWGSLFKSANAPAVSASSNTNYEAVLNKKIMAQIHEWTAVPQPNLTKGEFEPTKEFELRKQKAEAERQEAFNRKYQGVKERMPDLYSTSFLEELGPPQISDIKYDADREKFTFNIQASKYSYVIKTTLKAPVQEAPAVKDLLARMDPIVLFEIKDESVTPKSVILQSRAGDPPVVKRLDFAGEQMKQALHIGEKTLANLDEDRKHLAETDYSKLPADQQRASAASGNAVAQKEMGQQYSSGRDGVPQDDKEAAAWYRKAEELQRIISRPLNQQNVIYADGLGTPPQDSMEAISWYKQAANTVLDEAQNNLAVLLVDDVKANTVGSIPIPWMWHSQAAHFKIIAWYLKAAELGLVKAQIALGIKYSYFYKEHVEAIFWFHKAAEQGDASAMNNLGVELDEMEKESGTMHLKPKIEGILGYKFQTYAKESVVWFRKAAELGLVSAQFELGKMYNSERQGGIPKDKKEAIFWFRKAAEQGLGDAQRVLGRMYADNVFNRYYGNYHRSIPKDDKDAKEAVAWFRKAAGQGFSDGGVLAQIEERQNIPCDSFAEELQEEKVFIYTYAGNTEKRDFDRIRDDAKISGCIFH